MSFEFQPPENSRNGLRTDLETLAALRTGLFESIEKYYDRPDAIKYRDVADSQFALAKHFGETLDTIFYFDGFTTYDRFDLARDLQINEDTARVDFLNGLIDNGEEEDIFRPANAPDIEDWYPLGVLGADPSQINFEHFRNYEVDKLIEHTNSDMRAVLVYAIHRWSRN